MDINSLLVLAIGVLTMLIAVMHIGIPVFIGWYKEISNLSTRTKRTVIDRNSFLILMLIIIAYLCFVFPEELITSELGRSFILLLGVYWIVRGFWRVIGYPEGVFRYPAGLIYIITGVLCLLALVKDLDFSTISLPW